MKKIIANGIEVELIDGELIVEPEEYQEQFDELLQRQEPIGGTYYPPTNTLLVAYNVMKNMFFDEEVDVEVIGELEEIPYEEDIIY